MAIESILLYSGLGITGLLNDWAQSGVFSYVLPFLLIFAFVYGLLAKIKVFGENKGVNAIIALAIGGLSLVNDYVPRFFESIIPNLGIAISILLAAIILGGLFLDDDKFSWVKKVIWAVGAIAFLAVVFSSLSDFTFSGNFFWYEYGSTLITLVLLVGAIAFVIFGAGKKP